MSLTLNEVFTEHFEHVKFDGRLAAAVYKYQVGYINQNPEHMRFFGGAMLGVEIIRFKDKDVLRLFNDVLSIDYSQLMEDVRKVPTINHDYLISGDIFNLTCMYMIHRFLTANTLGQTQRNRAAYDIALVFFYRCMAAILSDWIKYQVDPKLAQAAYANLSNKFLIKKLGTWKAVMDYRAKDLTDKVGIHYDSLMKFNDDSKIVYVLNDSQGRIRDLLKNYYAELMLAHQDGSRIGISKGTQVDADGEETLKEKTKSGEAYLTYLRKVISDKHGFVKDDLVDVIVNINTNSSFRIIKHSLLWMSESYGDPKEFGAIDEFLALVMTQSLHLVEHNIEPRRRKDYPYVLTTLKNLFLSTRSTDPELDKIRKLGETLVVKANGKISSSLLMATRTSLILYIALRALTGQAAR